MTNVLWEILIAALCCISPTPPQRNEEVQTSSSFITVVTKVLETRGRSASVEYRGVCAASGGITDSFNVATPSRNVSAIQALHDAFANEPRLKATEEASGLIRVVGGEVQTDLLDITIREFIFNAETDPRDVTYKVLALPEVRAYMEAHRIKFITTIRGVVPTPRGVRLTGTIRNVTLSQALDRIAQAFSGEWIYGECATVEGERKVYVKFHEFSAPPGSGQHEKRGE
jgi:hypothetical protein